MKLSHCHFTEAGRERGRESRATDSAWRKFLTATAGWIWNGAFCSRQVQRERESWSLLKRKSSGEIKWREVGREERAIVLS